MKERVLVDVIARFVQHRGRQGHGLVEPGRVNGNAVPFAEPLIALPAERGAGVDEREIDVEENSADCAVHAAGSEAGSR